MNLLTHITFDAKGSQASRVLITNVITLLSSFVTLLYSVFFYFILDLGAVSLLNLLASLLYLLSIYFSSKALYRLASIWMLTVFISYLSLLSTVIFTPAAGFHYYLLTLPTAIILLFNENEKAERYFFFLLGGAVFFSCLSYENSNPLVVLSVTLEQSFTVTAFLLIMVVTFVAMTLFAVSMSDHEAKLEQLAAKDPLTGIDNRRSFFLLGEGLFKCSKRDKSPLSLLLLDIDYFKRINDKHGHIMGDKVLQNIAKILQSNLRDSDCLARYGGEEFVILLPNTDGENAAALAESLRCAVDDYEDASSLSEHIHCTVSIGISHKTTDEICLMQLLQQADLALYQAKSEGRNRIEIYANEAHLKNLDVISA